LGIAIITIVKKKKKKGKEKTKPKQTKADCRESRAEKINHRTKRPAMNLSGANTNKGGNFEFRKGGGNIGPSSS
jgi:hypothetical protein